MPNPLGQCQRTGLSGQRNCSGYLSVRGGMVCCLRCGHELPDHPVSIENREFQKREKAAKAQARANPQKLDIDTRIEYQTDAADALRQLILAPQQARLADMEKATAPRASLSAGKAWGSAIESIYAAGARPTIEIRHVRDDRWSITNTFHGAGVTLTDAAAGLLEDAQAMFNAAMDAEPALGLRKQLASTLAAREKPLETIASADRILAETKARRDDPALLNDPAISETLANLTTQENLAAAHRQASQGVLAAIDVRAEQVKARLAKHRNDVARLVVEELRKGLAREKEIQIAHLGRVAAEALAALTLVQARTTALSQADFASTLLTAAVAVEPGANQPRPDAASTAITVTLPNQGSAEPAPIAAEPEPVPEPTEQHGHRLPARKRQRVES